MISFLSVECMGDGGSQVRAHMGWVGFCCPIVLTVKEKERISSLGMA